MFEPRYAANLPVSVTGADVNGNVFRQTTRIINLSRRGARMNGVSWGAHPGDLVEVGYGGKRAQFLIVWVKPKIGVAGICCLDEDKEIWGNALSQAENAARMAGAKQSEKQPAVTSRVDGASRPQSPMHPFCAGPVAKSFIEAGKAANGNSDSAGTVAIDPQIIPEAPHGTEVEILRGQPSTGPSSSFYGASIPSSLLERPASASSLAGSEGKEGGSTNPPQPAGEAPGSRMGLPLRMGGEATRTSFCAPLELVAPVHPRVSDVQQRKYPRYACSGGVTAWIKGSSSKLWGQLNVISLGGCYVDTTAPFRPQTELDLLIGALGIQVRAQGRVTSYDRHAGMGVRFTKIGEADAVHLRRLLMLASAPATGRAGD